MAERYPIVDEEGKCIRQDRGEPVSEPRYATFHTSIVVTGKKGRAPGELDSSSGVVIHEETHQIFVANYLNHRVEIFSETGEFLYQLGVGQLSRPCGIATHGDSLYVSCTDDTVNKFSLNEMCRVKRIGGEGSNNGQFNSPGQLTTDPIGRVFIRGISNGFCIDRSKKSGQIARCPPGTEAVDPFL